ncbi:hypothetical protein [Rhizobium mesoamericanum]|uniref:hypothetical protein n=1 Tax=Rhizobium mesoamericanum TaxID=1079800 RepID=UPI0002E7F8DA|nr:hypothetical protein [Rhizobium mesoamericanum]
MLAVHGTLQIVGLLFFVYGRAMSNEAISLFLACAFALIGAFVLYINIMRDTSEWHRVTRYRKVRLENGRWSADSELWGRQVRGEWQYREMTDAEHNQAVIDDAI